MKNKENNKYSHSSPYFFYEWEQINLQLHIIQKEYQFSFIFFFTFEATIPNTSLKNSHDHQLCFLYLTKKIYVITTN